ncbi:MAG TPA: PQQ-binding-like beta-propeller repeat protein [Candidatus Babeliales bacterium]|nr:PQQ-binding-like beta-propeller repeat protein [Candidatus Babeliales bacterium]
MKVLKILLSVAVMSAACVPHVLYPAHPQEVLEEDAAARAEVARQLKLREFQQAEADRLKREGGARAVAAAQRVAAQEVQGLDDADDEGLQQVLAESLEPKRLVRSPEEEKEEGEKKVHSKAWRQHREDFEGWESEDAAARARRRGLIEYDDEGMLRLVGGVPTTVATQYMGPFLSNKEPSFLDKDAGILSTTIEGSKYISHVAVSSDGKTIAGLTRYGKVSIWDAVTEKLIRTFDSGIREDLEAISGDGRRIVAGTATQMIIWDALTRTSKKIKNYRACVHRALSADGKAVATVLDADHGVVVWNADTGEPQATFDIGQNRNVDSIAMSADGTLIVSAKYKKLYIADAHGNKPLDFITVDSHGTKIAIAPDGSFIVTTTQDGSLHVWNLITEELTHTLKDPRESASAADDIAISGDSSFIAAAYADGIRIWRLQSRLILTYGRRAYVLNEATSLRNQAKMVCKFPTNRLQVINKGVALLKRADVSRPDFEAYLGKIKDRINKAFTQGMQEAVDYLLSIQARANKTKNFPDKLRKEINQRVNTFLQQDQSQDNFTSIVNDAVRDVDQLFQKGEAGNKLPDVECVAS